MNNEIKGKYEERKCKCGNIFYVPLGGVGQMKLKNTRPRHAKTCSPKCSKIHRKSNATKMDNKSLGVGR